MGDDNQVRFRIRVSGGRGGVRDAFSLENLMCAADDLKKRTLEDKGFWDEAAALADDLRRQIKTRDERQCHAGFP
jgi:hypothetical protein